jgi:hypothetical protein
LPVAGAREVACALPLKERVTGWPPLLVIGPVDRSAMDQFLRYVEFHKVEE